MTDPAAIVRGWFDAWAREDFESARRVMAADASFHPSAPRPGGAKVRGWDAFRAWYQRRREAEGQGFSYELGDVLATADHAVAFITLRAIRGGRPHAWQQVAVYRIDHGRIAEIWLFEDQPRAIGA